MPAIPLSAVCLRCQQGRADACYFHCPESRRIDRIFRICTQDGVRCRHIEACGSDPRTCGYWRDIQYPIVELADASGELLFTEFDEEIKVGGTD